MAWLLMIGDRRTVWIRKDRMDAVAALRFVVGHVEDVDVARLLYVRGIDDVIRAA